VLLARSAPTGLPFGRRAQTFVGGAFDVLIDTPPQETTLYRVQP
jgi:hypothetical protein